MQVSKSLLHSGIRQTGEYFGSAALTAMIFPTSPFAPSALHYFPLLSNNHDVIAASQGVR